MLIVRKEQIDAFRRRQEKRFEDETVANLFENYPEDCALLGEETVRSAVRSGVEQAMEYGIVKEYDVSRYINLMFVFGKDFDIDPDLPWAARILQSPDLIATRRMDALYREAAHHLPEQRRR